jgi:IclR family mhp operon transcriptional activator
MQARYSTRSHSPFSLDRIYIGRRIALLVSALGRAYFAFSSEETRAVLLAALQGTGREMDNIAHDEAYVEQMVSTVRQAGYAMSGAPLHDDRAFGLAVPVLKDGEAVAAITMRFIRTAMSPEKAARFVPELQKTAAIIAAEV